MKKLLSMLMPLALVMTMTGCNSKPAEEEKGLVFSNWSGAEEGSKDSIKYMIDEFNKSSGDMNQVEQLNWPWGDTVTQAAQRASGSEKYDVAQIDIRMLPALAEAGILANLDDLFGKDFFDKNFDEGTASVGEFNGVQYGVPWTVAPMAMISNPRILAESGVDFDIVTIADFEKACEMVLKNHPQNTDADKTNDVIPYAVMNKDAGTTAPDFLAWLWTFGGNLFEDGEVAIDSEAGIKTLEWFKSLKDKGYTQDAIGRGDARTLYKEGRVAFYDDALMSKGAIYNEKFGDIEEQAKPIARPVLKEGDANKAVGWGHLLVVLEKSNKKDAAKEFINHMISEDMALYYFEKNGLLPSKQEVLNSDAVKSDYWSASWAPIMNGGRLSETAGTKEGAYNQAITDSLQALLSGNKTAAECAEAIKTGIKNS